MIVESIFGYYGLETDMHSENREKKMSNWKFKESGTLTLQLDHSSLYYKGK